MKCAALISLVRAQSSPDGRTNMDALVEIANRKSVLFDLTGSRLDRRAWNS